MSTDVFTSPYGPGFLLTEVCFKDGVISISFPKVDIIVFLPQPLEAHRLLEGVTQAQVGAVGDGHVGNVHAVQQNLAAGGLVDTGNDFGQRGFAAAVGAGDGHKTVLHSQADIPQNLFIVVGLKADMTKL